MPEISRFFGIVVSMFFDGSLSPRALGLVVEWAAEHQDELLDAWERAQAGEPPPKIRPLG